MCLAKAYLQAGGTVSTTAGQSRPPAASGGSGATAAPPLMENVTRVDVEGEQISLRNLFGEKRMVRGRIASIDFGDSNLILEGVEA